MDIDRDAVRAAAKDGANAARRWFQVLDQSWHELFALLVMPETTDAPKAPRVRAILAVDGYGMIIAATEVGYFNVIQRRHVAVFSALHVEHNSLGDFFKAESHLCTGDEVLSIGVVTQGPIFRASERMQSSLQRGINEYWWRKIGFSNLFANFKSHW